ncbi:hypothetical protein Droror1_Dr00006176 [Drosera rotundifolia]
MGLSLFGLQLAQVRARSNPRCPTELRPLLARAGPLLASPELLKPAGGRIQVDEVAVGGGARLGRSRRLEEPSPRLAELVWPWIELRRKQAAALAVMASGRGGGAKESMMMAAGRVRV